MMEYSIHLSPQFLKLIQLLELVTLSSKGIKEPQLC